MSNNPKQKNDHNHPIIYQIRIKGHVDEQSPDWFRSLTITLEESGDTLLTGPVHDQAELFGLLRRVRDLGMQLISVNCVDTGNQNRSTGKL